MPCLFILMEYANSGNLHSALGLDMPLAQARGAGGQGVGKFYLRSVNFDLMDVFYAGSPVEIIWMDYPL